MRISFADAGLLAIDTLTGMNAACLFIFEDERPLKGLSGYLDWRLCGALSRILREGRFVGAHNDALLFPCQRVSMERIFCFGAGKRGELDGSRYASLMRRAYSSLALAGAKAVVSELPLAAKIDEPERAKIFLQEGAGRFHGELLFLLGDGKALAKSFSQVGERDQRGLEIDREPWGAVSVVVAPPRKPVAPLKLQRK